MVFESVVKSKANIHLLLESFGKRLLSDRLKPFQTLGPVSHLFQEVSECKQRKAYRSGVLWSKPRQRGRVAAEPARRKPLEGRASGERALPAGVRRAQHQPPPRHREARARSVRACARVKGWAGLRRASQASPARASWEPAPSGRWFICLWAVPLCPALLRSPGVCSLPWPRQRVSRVVVAAIAVMEAFPTAAPSPGKQVQEPRRGHRQEAGGPAHFVDPGSWALFC